MGGLRRSISSSSRPFAEEAEGNETFRRTQRKARTHDGIPLPDGWRECLSPSRGIYYAHEATGVTQFEFPTGPPTSQQIAQVFEQKHGRKLSMLHPGAKVQFTGLITAPQLNGKTGICDRWEGTEWVRVRLPTGELKAVKPQNLLVLEASEHRVKPERLLPVGGDEEASAGASRGRWASKRVVLASLTLGVLAYPALMYAWAQAGLSLREPAAGPAKPQVPAIGQKAGASDAAVQPAPLPTGWREHLDAATGRPYYWKEADPAGTTTWVRPTA